jgi:glyceraldehyde 3-phosphate dehydrogenase
MVKLGINGLGRIGRSILRGNLEKKVFDIVIINDINNDINNIAYLINYDSIYGSLNEKFSVNDGYIENKSTSIKYHSESRIDLVPWKDYDVDILIDSSGILENIALANTTLQMNNLKNIIITNSPEEVDFTFIYGVNDEYLNPNVHKIISSSICDASAIGPVLKILDDNFGIDYGYITTLHPWLNYQNLLDGNAASWSMPGSTHENYALGRMSVGNMIPKPTTLLPALSKSMSNIDFSKFSAYSFRTSHHIVTASEIIVSLKTMSSKDDIVRLFGDISINGKELLIYNNFEPLVSLDFLKSEYSVNIDQRWTDLINNNLLRLVVFYDNEWSYAQKVIKLVERIISLEVS